MRSPLKQIDDPLTQYQHLSDCYNAGVQALRLIERSLGRCGVQVTVELVEPGATGEILPDAALDSACQIMAMLQSVAGDELPPNISRAVIALSTVRDLCELFGELEYWCDMVRDTGQGLKDELFPSESEE